MEVAQFAQQATLRASARRISLLVSLVSLVGLMAVLKSGLVSPMSSVAVLRPALARPEPSVINISLSSLEPMLMTSQSKLVPPVPTLKAFRP